MPPSLTDQFGNAVPDDLVRLTWDYIDATDMGLGAPLPYNDFQKRLLARIDRINWFDVTIDGHEYLAVSWRALTAYFRTIFDADELPAGERTSVMYVSPALQRWGPADGFYHA